MTVWLIDDQGQSHFLSDTFTPTFFVYGSQQELHELCENTGWWRSAIKLRRAERYDLFLRRDLELLEIVVQDPARFYDRVQTVRSYNPTLTFYNSAIPVPQLYFYDRDLFPLARVEVEIDASKRIRAIQLCDSRDDVDYELPDFKIMKMRLEGEGNPNRSSRPRPVEIMVEGTTRILDEDKPKEFLTNFRELLIQYDPDLILTEYGDSYILPRLIQRSYQHGGILPLNRDSNQDILFKKALSYSSYGRKMYRPSSCLLFGRLHIDLNTVSLLSNSDGLDGLFETSRLAQMQIQHVARTTTGGCFTSMQMSTARRQGILIPSDKTEVEEFQSLDEFVRRDNGGLIFRPALGLHERAADLDGAQMFPNIMLTFNISVETLNCACCPDSYVPELNLRVCEKRVGLLPATLAPIIAKRRKIKEALKTLPPGKKRNRYECLADVARGLGYVSFGYQGAVFAVFGHVTAHQAICAYAREILLTAKESAEKHGFRLLHGYVDALFVQKQDASDEDYEELARVISVETGLRFELKRIYNLVAFLPSRQDPLLSVPNRYFCFSQDDEMKVRGIESRRADTPPFIRNAQMKFLQVLSAAKNRVEFVEQAREVLTLACDYLDTLRSGQVPFHELVISQRLSHDPNQYTTNTLNASVVKQLLEAGVKLEPGETVQYVILNRAADAYVDRARALEQLDGSEGYDVAEYEKLFVRSLETILAPIGITQPMLEKYFGEWRALPPSARAQLRKPKPELPLFEWAMTNPERSATNAVRR